MLIAPWILPAASAALSFLGGERQNKKARQEAERNRQFQERMRNTAWQAGVEDMRAAGLNPALAYSKGPAMSPGGSMAGVPSNSVGDAVSSAMQAKRLRAELKTMTAMADKTEAEAGTAYANQRVAEWKAGYMLGIDKSRNRQPILELTEAEIARAKMEARKSELMGDTMEPLAALSARMGEWLPLLAFASQLLPGGMIKGATNLLRGKKAVRAAKAARVVPKKMRRIGFRR